MQTSSISEVSITGFLLYSPAAIFFFFARAVTKLHILKSNHAKAG